eukprot:1940082-Rhodomonas_salina.1
MECPVLVQRMLLCDARYWCSVCCYVLSSTGVAYAAMRCPVLLCCPAPAQRILLCIRYAMSGTDVQYAGTPGSYQPQPVGRKSNTSCRMTL